METALQALLGLVGFGLVLMVITDVLQTTLLLHGGGPLTSRLARLLWRGAVHRWGGRNHQALSRVGPLILLTTVMVWALLFWIGWTLLFLLQPEAVVRSTTGEPADLVSRLYYVGYTLVTLGVGDYRTGAPVWQILTIIASASGFFLMTLVITYLLPLVSAVVQKRQLGGYISSLGLTPDAILDRAWNGRDYKGLSGHLASIAPQVHQLAQQHLAYPILHCFHSRSRRTASAPALAALDEALTLLDQAPPEHRPEPVSCRVLRDSLDQYLQTLQQNAVTEAMEAPPPPCPQILLDHGVTDTDREPQQSEQLRRHRQLLRAMVHRHGWSWEEVTSPDRSAPGR